MKKQDITREANANLPTRYGKFTITIFRSHPDNLEHTVIYMGTLKDRKNILLRVHSQCFTGDTLFFPYGVIVIRS